MRPCRCIKACHASPLHTLSWVRALANEACTILKGIYYCGTACSRCAFAARASIPPVIHEGLIHLSQCYSGLTTITPCAQAAAERIKATAATEAAAHADAEARSNQAASLRRQVAELEGRLSAADNAQVH